MFPTRDFQEIPPNPPIRTSSLPAMFDQRIPNNISTQPFIRPSPSGRMEALISKKEANKSNNKAKRKSKEVGFANGNGVGEEEWLDENVNLNVTEQVDLQEEDEKSRQVALTQLVTMLLEQPLESNRYSQQSTSWKMKYGLSKTDTDPKSQRRNLTSPATFNLNKSKIIRKPSQKATKIPRSSSRVSIKRNKEKKLSRFRSFVKNISCAGGNKVETEISSEELKSKSLKRRVSDRRKPKSRPRSSGGRKSETKKVEEVNSQAWVDISLNSGGNHSLLGISLSSHTIQETNETSIKTEIPIIQRISPSPTSSLDSSQIFVEAREEQPSANSDPIPIHPCDRSLINNRSLQNQYNSSKVIHSSHLRQVQNIDDSLSHSFSSLGDESFSLIEGRLEGEESKAEIEPVLSSTPPKKSSSKEERRVFSNHSLPSTLPDTIEQSDEMILSPSQMDEGEFISNSRTKGRNGRKSSESDSTNSSNSMKNYLKFGPSIGLTSREIRRASPREELLKQKQKQLNRRERENLSKSRNEIEIGGEDESYDTLDHLPEWIENYCSTPPKSNSNSNRQSNSNSTPQFNHTSNSYTNLVTSRSNPPPVRSSTIGSKKERKIESSANLQGEGNDFENVDCETSISFSAWVDLERYQQNGIAGSRSASGGHLRSISGKHIIDRDVFVEGLEAKSGLDRLCEALDEAEAQIVEPQEEDDEKFIADQDAYLAPLISTSSENQERSTGTDRKDDTSFAGLEGLSRSDSARAITRALGLGGIVTLDSAELIHGSESKRDLMVSESNSFDSDNIFYAGGDGGVESDGSIFERRQAETSLERNRSMNQLIKENSHLEETLENETLHQGRIYHVGSGELNLDDFPIQDQDLDQDQVEEVQSPLPQAFSPPASPASFDHHLAGTPCTWFLSTIDEKEEEEEDQTEDDGSMDDTFALKETTEMEEKGSSMHSSQSLDPDNSSIGLIQEQGQTIWKEDYPQTNQVQSSSLTSSPILFKVLKVTQSQSVASNLNSELVFSSSDEDVEIGRERERTTSGNGNGLEEGQRYELDDESEEERSFKQEMYQQSLIAQVKVKTKKRGQGSSNGSHLLSPSSDASPSGNLIGLSPILESPNPDSSKFRDLSHHSNHSSHEDLPEVQELTSSTKKRKEKPTSLWGQESASTKGQYPKFSFSQPSNEEDEESPRLNPSSPISPTSLLPLPWESASINESKRGSWSSGVSSYESEMESRRTSTATSTSSQGGHSVATSITSQGKEREVVKEEEKIININRGQSVLKKSGSLLSFHSSFSVSDLSSDDYHSSNESEVSHGGLIDTFPIAPETQHQAELASTSRPKPNLAKFNIQQSQSNQAQLLEELKHQLENKKADPKPITNVHPKIISPSNSGGSSSQAFKSIPTVMKSSDSQEIDQMLNLTESGTSSSLGVCSSDGEDKRFRHRISPGIAARFQAAYTYTRPSGSNSNPNLPQSASQKALVESVVDSQE